MFSAITPAREDCPPSPWLRSCRLQPIDTATTTAVERSGLRTRAGSRSGPSDSAISPAARAIIEGSLFARTFEIEIVEAHYKSRNGAMGDVVVIRGCGDETDAHRQSLRAIQVRDLEMMIAADEIIFIFGPRALDLNRARGWGVHTIDDHNVIPSSESCS